MNIRGLLFGSAAAMVAVSGAQAADAIIIAEPEPVEYVRVCDVYGAGFFYIPGTETCLQIGGYIRYQMNYSNEDWIDDDGGENSYIFWKSARFAPSFDIRSETEWGTLRGFAHAHFDWDSLEDNDVYIEHGFIELQSGSGTLLIGKTDNPYARFFDAYGADGHIDGDYGGQIYNSGEISYTFAADNGFSAVIAAVETGTGLFEPNIEVGANFEQDWGSVGGIFGYDNPDDSWGAKAVVRVNFDPVSLGVHVLYSDSESGVYGAVNPGSGETSEWSILAHAGVQVSDTVSVNGYFQWFDSTTNGGSAYQVKGGLGLTPVENLEILPEVRYTNVSGGDDAWEGVLRFTRNF